MRRMMLALLVCLLVCLCGSALAASYIPAATSEIANAPGLPSKFPSIRWETGTYTDPDPDYGYTCDAIFIHTDWEPVHPNDVVMELLAGDGDAAGVHYYEDVGCWVCEIHVEDFQNMTLCMYDGYYESATLTSYVYSLNTSSLVSYSRYEDGYTFDYRPDGSIFRYRNDYDDYTAAFDANGQLEYYEYITWGQARFNVRNELIYLWAEYDQPYEYRSGVWYVLNRETWEYDIPVDPPRDYSKSDFPPRLLGFPKVYNLPDGTLEISDGAFRGTPVTEVHIPAGCLTIGDNAFSDCTLLRELHIPESVTNIGSLSNVPNLTIYATRETAAHQYAITNEIPFIAE